MGVEAVSRIILWLPNQVGVLKKAHPLEGSGSYIQNYIMATWPSWGVTNSLRGVEALSRIILWLLYQVGCVKKAHPLEGSGSCTQNYIMATWPSWDVTNSLREWKLYQELYYGYLAELGG